jgi:hypothetical protein
MLELLLRYYDLGVEALAGKVSLERILALPEREELARLREISSGDFASRAAEIGERLQAVIRGLKPGGAKT